MPYENSLVNNQKGVQELVVFLLTKVSEIIYSNRKDGLLEQFWTPE